MTRGPPPEDAFKEAAAIAGRRGTLRWFDRADRDSGHFAIFGIDFVSIVGIRRARRIHCCPSEILWEFANTIAGLKCAVLTRQVLRELWLCSYHGTWRFFRITDSDLAELDLEGRLVTGPGPAPS
jgi:hypothetical protein